MSIAVVLGEGNKKIRRWFTFTQNYPKITKIFETTSGPHKIVTRAAFRSLLYYSIDSDLANVSLYLSQVHITIVKKWACERFSSKVY